MEELSPKRNREMTSIAARVTISLRSFLELPGV
jgi:hypothetical protein